MFHHDINLFYRKKSKKTKTKQKFLHGLYSCKQVRPIDNKRDQRSLKVQLPIFLFFVSLKNALYNITVLFFFHFYLYIYPPDSQESAVGSIHRTRSYPDMLPKMLTYCCPLEILIEI